MIKLREPYRTAVRKALSFYKMFLEDGKDVECQIFYSLSGIIQVILADKDKHGIHDIEAFDVVYRLREIVETRLKRG